MSWLQKVLILEYNCVDKPSVAVNYFEVTSVRLITSASPHQGILEVTIKNTKSKVCNKSLDNGAKEVVCKQLGYRGFTDRNSKLFKASDTTAGKFSGEISCSGGESKLSQCCVNNATKDKDCKSFALVSCSVCTEPLLEDEQKFPDSAFSASLSLSDHGAAKARVSSNSSWCAPSYGQTLDIDLGRSYVINSTTTFGDSVMENWVIFYRLLYSTDKKRWHPIYEGNRENIRGNTDAKNSPAKFNFSPVTAQALRFSPVSWKGNPCMKIEICGHTLLPGQVGNLVITKVTSSTVSFSWNPPTNKGDTPVLEYRLRVFRRNSTVPTSNKTVKLTTQSVIRGLLPYTEYVLSVAAWNSHGFGDERRIIFTTAEAAPSAPPQNVSVMAESSSSLLVSWENPAEDKRNGIISSYTVCVSLSKDGSCFKTYTTDKKSFVFPNLKASTKYYVRVSAATKGGSGGFSEARERYTNGESVSKPSVATTSTLSFPLQTPPRGFRYFEVIALKLLDGKPPSRSPDSYLKGELVNYFDARNLSVPKPYIAAVLETSKKPETFVLGDGGNFSQPIKRRRRSTTEYHNGPLERGSSYSMFQRFYRDQDDYYSTDWSPPAQTLEQKAVSPQDSASGTNKAPVIVGVVVAVLFLSVIVVVFIILWRRRSKDPGQKSYTQEQEKSEELGLQYLNEGGEVEDDDRMGCGVNEILSSGYELPNEAESGYNDTENVYGNEEVIVAYKPRGPIPVSEFESYVESMKPEGTYDFKKEFEGLPSGHQFTWDVAKRSFNKPKNRYGNIVTYDYSRVVLSGDEKRDYINATHIDGATKNYYIASQGPRKNTINDFWRMVFEQKCPTIVMLTSLKELGKVKCEKYWPDDSGMYDEILITLLETREFADHVTREFLLKKDDEELRVMQFHFTNWPDHGVPHYPTQLLSFRSHFMSEHNKRSGPVVVHCSAGVGRTGVFIAVDRVIQELDGSTGADAIDIVSQVKGMRTRRMNMVQTLEQYVFIHEAILDHVKCGDNEVDAANLRIEINKLSKTNSQEETGFEQKFKRLNDVSPSFTHEECEAALSPENKSKNRHAHIYPCEVSRVYLKYLEDVENSDYINACYVDGFLGKNYFIATQTPLKKTINDFWRMIFEHNSSTIVMLNQSKENGKEFPVFWSVDRARPTSFGSVTLQLDSTKKKDNIVLRKFIIASSQDLKGGRTINLIQYLGWPDHGTPDSNDDVLKLLTEVENSKRTTETGPVTVVCSNGAGRTGTYIAISNLADIVKALQVVDVFQCIKQIRSKRPQFVENAGQFRSCYEVTEALLESFNLYSNFEMKEI